MRALGFDGLDEDGFPIVDGPSMTTPLVIFFVFFAVIVILAIATGIYRYKATKRLALDAGLDRSTATGFALTSESGLEAAFLADQLKRSASAPKAADSGERLRELKTLLDQGLISRPEYDERRQAIIDSI